MSEKTGLYIDEMEPREAPKAAEGAKVAETGMTAGQAETALETKTVASETKVEAPGAKVTTPEEQKANAKQDLKDKGLRAKLAKVPKKTWILMGVLAVVLVAAIVMAVVMLGGGNSGSQGNKVPNTSVSGNDGTGDNNGTGDGSGDEGGEGDEPGEETGIITLSTGDARVQKLYGYFSPISMTSELGRLGDFYTNRGSFSGELSELMMVDLAMANLAAGQCVLPATEGSLMERYADWMGSDEQMPTIEVFQVLYNVGCYSGQAVRDKVKEIFGKDLKLMPELFAGDGMYWGYDAENDEIYATNTGRGGVFPVFNRSLLKAERDNERMYLYEEVSISIPGGPELVSLYDKCLLVQDQEAYEKNGCGAEDYEWQTGATKFKLVFKRTDAGNYVFEKIERAERE